MNSPDALMLCDVREVCQEDWEEIKIVLVKFKIKWKWIEPSDWDDGKAE